MGTTAGLLSVLIFAAAQAAAPPATPQHHQRPPDERFRLQPLAGGVHALYGRGGNVGFLVGPEAVLVVDSQFKDMAPGIAEQIKNVTDKPIKYLVNTHHHGDHVGGNETFRPIAVIIAHDNVRKRMLASPESILRDAPAQVAEARKAGNEARAKQLEEQMEWARKVKVEEIQVWHTPPAHTDGDSVVLFQNAKVLHMGDLFFHKVVPFIDVKSGSSPAGYLKALDAVIARAPADVTVIPGHGEVTNLDGLRGMRLYVSDLMAAARKAQAARRTDELGS